MILDEYKKAKRHLIVGSIISSIWIVILIADLTNLIISIVIKYYGLETWLLGGISLLLDILLLLIYIPETIEALKKYKDLKEKLKNYEE